MMKEIGRESSESRFIGNLYSTQFVLYSWLGMNVMLLIICSTAIGHFKGGSRSGWLLFCHGGYLMLAFASVGTLVGFLFGVPRKATGADRQSQPKAELDREGGSSNVSIQDPNTNLEQVSDWLTKIILGAGLTQLTNVPRMMVRLGEYFKPGFDDSPLLPVVIIVNSLIFGFFAGYLLTRLFLARAFFDADNELRTIKVALTAAGTFEKTRQYKAATATLESALAELQPGTSKEAKQRLYEALTYNSLYEPEPEGFRKAIQYANKYLQEEGGSGTARLFAHLASALGQKYKWDQGHQSADSELRETRNQALAAARRAIEMQPQMKEFLKRLWDPNDPVKVPTEEDDLEAFYGDPDFIALLS